MRQTRKEIEGRQAELPQKSAGDAKNSKLWRSDIHLLLLLPAIPFCAFCASSRPVPPVHLCVFALKLIMNCVNNFAA
jgi:hypothetical protein